MRGADPDHGPGGADDLLGDSSALPGENRERRGSGWRDDAAGWTLPASLSGRYRIDAELGAGVQARVVRAHDGLLHRDVAVKMFRIHDRVPGRIDRASDEARLLAALNHRALITLYDVGTDRSSTNPLTYLVMEYVRGPDLHEHLKAGALQPVQVCWLGYDLSDGLDYLHEAGFLHRDVKPANVLLTERRPGIRLRAKLTDFGISALIRAGHTPGRVTGTAAYIAPEQAEDLPPTEASDVYALGLVLIEALTGSRVFPGGKEESAYARLERQPELPEDVPAPLGELLTAMTARRPGARPSAAAAAERFRALALGEGMHMPEQVDAAARGESARLAAVQRYHILDTPPEDAFDDLTALAARVLHAPSAVVTITDQDRVWLKSRHDFAEQHIDRNSALCTLTSPGKGPWSITDAAADPRTRNNPLVTADPHIRGYAAAPLRTHDGHVIGTFCVLDHRPHDFTREDLAILTALAAVVMRELELRLATRRVIFNRSIRDPAPPLPAAEPANRWDTHRSRPTAT